MLELVALMILLLVGFPLGLLLVARFAERLFRRDKK
jgi:F0F1-type ATP synthase assembly protein I